MQNNVSYSLGILRTTVVGGLFFLLPIAAISILLGKVYSVVTVIAVPLQKWLPIHSVLGIVVLFTISVLILMLICFGCGLLATRTLAKKFSDTLEKQVMTVFPKYAIYKDILAGNLRNNLTTPSLLPVLLSIDGGFRIAFETDRLASGMVVVFLPGAPDAWIGSVVLVTPDRIHACDIPFNEAVGIFERLGRGSSRFLSASPLMKQREALE